MSDVEETIQCTNCKHDILPSNFTIHFVHCQRNFFLCSKCQRPVNFCEKIKHETEDHSVIKCRNCHIEFEKWLLNDHIKKDCPFRKVKCQICDIEVKASDIKEHENYCGARTEKCPECGEFVMLKYKSIHIESNHTFIKLSDEPGPSPSWQNGRRTLHNFMPDLTSKNYKPLTSHKRRSNESRKLRAGESNRSRISDEFDENLATSPSNNISEETEPKGNEAGGRKSFKKDIDEWPALSSLMSLQISEDDKEKSKANNYKQTKEDEESDLMYALEVSEQLNSHIWEKDLLAADNMFKNSYKSYAENSAESDSKNVNKYLFPTKSKKESDDVKVCNKDNNFDLLSSSNKINKFEVQSPVKIPCEFCGTLIVSHDLICHLSRCRVLMKESFGDRNSRHKFSCLTEDIEKKVACGFCNKFFRLSVLENHQFHCQRNSSKSGKTPEKINHSKNLKSMKIKSEPGLQNGVEPSSPRLSRRGTRSEWLSEFSNGAQEEDTQMKNNLSFPEAGVTPRPTKLSRKNRRAPSPPKM